MTKDHTQLIADYLAAFRQANADTVIPPTVEQRGGYIYVGGSRHTAAAVESMRQRLLDRATRFTTVER